MAEKKDNVEEQFSVRIPSEIADEVRTKSREIYGNKAGSIKKFVISAFLNELKRVKND